MMGGFVMSGRDMHDTGHDRIYSVNDIIASLDQFHGITVQITCVLCIEFEGDSIWHTPTAERLPDYGSSLWANFDCEAIGCRPQKLEGYNDRHVIVTVTVDREEQDHFSLWPGSVTIKAIDKGKDRT